LYYKVYENKSSENTDDVKKDLNKFLLYYDFNRRDGSLRKELKVSLRFYQVSFKILLLGWYNMVKLDNYLLRKKMKMKMIILTILTIASSNVLSADTDITDDGVKAYRLGDKIKAKDLYTKACDGGEMNGCFNLGVMYDNGDGVKENTIKAKELFGKACDGGEMNGCYELGLMYNFGDGVKENKIKAKDLYTKACDGGDIRGCSNLGRMYFYGDGVRQNKNGVRQNKIKAKEFFGKACDGGEMFGCKIYKILNEQEK